MSGRKAFPTINKQYINYISGLWNQSKTIKFKSKSVVKQQTNSSELERNEQGHQAQHLQASLNKLIQQVQRLMLHLKLTTTKSGRLFKIFTVCFITFTCSIMFS